MTEVSIVEAIQQFLQQRKLQGKVHALRIKEVWVQLMGKTIAQYTNEIKIVGNTLYISTTIAPLKQELMYQRALIMQRVNEALGENVIEEVVIQ